MRRYSGSHSFPENSGGGKHGLRDGYMPHIGDAMHLFNYCWSKTKARTIARCWMKSDCLSYLQVQQFEQICHDYSNDNEENVPDSPIERNEAEQLYEDIFVNSLLSQVQSQSNELLPEVGEVQSVDEFANILNSESSEDASIDRRNIADNLLQSLYDERSDSEAVTREENDLQTVPSSSSARELIGLIQEKVDFNVQLNNDREVIEALQALLTQMNEV